MKKNTSPIITHTEILARAIRTIEDDIAEWRCKCEAFPQEQRATMLAASTKELTEKLEALKTLYRFETGTDIY